MHKSAGQVSFCFEAKCWPALVQRAIVLRRVFRQKNQAFVQCLNELRTATLSDANAAALERAASHVLRDPEPTVLCAHNAKADALNRTKLLALPGASTLFRAVDFGEKYGIEQVRPGVASAHPVGQRSARASDSNDRYQNDR